MPPAESYKARLEKILNAVNAQVKTMLELLAKWVFVMPSENLGEQKKNPIALTTFYEDNRLRYGR